MNIILTGASDGIGLQLALMLDKPGVSLLLVGKREKASIDPGLASHLHYLSVNLDNPTGIQQVATAVYELGWDSVDMVIHNAGIGWIGASGDQPWSSIDELLSVNCLAPIALTHCLLPYLLKANGKIVFIGSSVTHQACPSFSVYAASKAVIAGLARSLRLELQDKVRVQLVHPGPTKTTMHTKAGLKNHWSRQLFRAPSNVANEILWAIDTDRDTVNLGSARYRFNCIKQFFIDNYENIKFFFLKKSILS